MVIWVRADRKRTSSLCYKMVPICLGLTHVASHTLWVWMLVCQLGVRRKVAESMPATHSAPLPGKAAGEGLLGTQRQESMVNSTAIHRDISRPCSMLHDRFSFYSNQKDLCAARCFPELRW